MKLVNEISGRAEWHTVAYIPVVRTEQETAAVERGRLTRCGMLQRMLHLAFRSTIAASHVGFKVRHGDRVVSAFPRILMYICDQPEERAVLGLKSGSCNHPCSNCHLHISVMGAPEVLRARDRAVVATLERQPTAPPAPPRAPECAELGLIDVNETCSTRATRPGGAIPC